MASKPKTEQAAEPTVGELVSLVAKLQGQIEDMRTANKAQAEAHRVPQEFKDEMAKSTAVRSQQNADGKWGTAAPRWTVQLVELNKKGEPLARQIWPRLDISANSDHEATGRYRELCGLVGSPDAAFAGMTCTAAGQEAKAITAPPRPRGFEQLGNMGREGVAAAFMESETHDVGELVAK